MSHEIRTYGARITYSRVAHLFNGPVLDSKIENILVEKFINCLHGDNNVALETYNDVVDV